MITLSIDPATHGCGCALWEGSELIAAGYAKNRTEYEGFDRWIDSARATVLWVQQHVPMVDQLVFELPQIYTRGKNKTKGDPNKIVIPLVVIEGALAAFFSNASTKTYQPHSWKGSVEKPESTKGPEYIILKRVRDDRLTAIERARVDWTGSVHHSWDVADGIGIGLHHLGRFERKRVFARE